MDKTTNLFLNMSSSAPDQGQESGNNSGRIVAAVIASILSLIGVVIIMFIAVYMVRRKRKSNLSNCSNDGNRNSVFDLDNSLHKLQSQNNDVTIPPNEINDKHSDDHRTKRRSYTISSSSHRDYGIPRDETDTNYPYFVPSSIPAKYVNQKATVDHIQALVNSQQFDEQEGRAGMLFSSTIDGDVAHYSIPRSIPAKYVNHKAAVDRVQALANSQQFNKQEGRAKMSVGSSVDGHYSIPRSIPAKYVNHRAAVDHVQALINSQQFDEQEGKAEMSFSSTIDRDVTHFSLPRSIPAKYVNQKAAIDHVQALVNSQPFDAQEDRAKMSVGSSVDGDVAHYSMPRSIPARYVNQKAAVDRVQALANSQQFDAQECRAKMSVGSSVDGHYSIPRNIPAKYVNQKAAIDHVQALINSQQFDAQEGRAGMSVGSSVDRDVAHYSIPRSNPAKYVNLKAASDHVQSLINSLQLDSQVDDVTPDENTVDSPYKYPSKEDKIDVFISQQKIKDIPRHTILVTGEIQSGYFGRMEKGIWKSTKDLTLEIALKTASEHCTTKDKMKLLKEAVTMGKLSHPNIVQLHGVVAHGNPLMLVMEYLDKGDLRTYLVQLKEQREDIDEKVPYLLLNFSEQVALGMHYLASRQLVHRDLAARNILVSEDETCKIGDFSLARDISKNGYYLGDDGKVALKWSAPEVIKSKKYSIASDVWSYGCILYEIWSLGSKPFNQVKNQEVVEKIYSGYRLPPPSGCPKAIYELMIQCWHPVSSARPKCQNILTSLLEDPKISLYIPLADALSHSLASVLGVSATAGAKMYTALQSTYLHST